jgi:hypothetical protein
LQGLNASINRAIELRRQFTDLTKPVSSGFNLKFNMLNDPQTPIATTRDGKQLPASLISNYGPYVQDASLINLLGDDSAQVSGEMVVGNSIEGFYDSEFNQGPIS